MKAVGLWAYAAFGAVCFVSAIYQMAANSVPLWWWLFIPPAAVAMVWYFAAAVQASQRPQPERGTDPQPED